MRTQYHLEERRRMGPRMLDRTMTHATLNPYIKISVQGQSIAEHMITNGNSYAG